MFTSFTPCLIAALARDTHAVAMCCARPCPNTGINKPASAYAVICVRYLTTCVCLEQVHYGRASLSELSRLPAYYVFPRRPIDLHATHKHVSNAAAAAAAAASLSALLVLMDQSYAHALPALQQLLRSRSASDAAGSTASTVAEGQTLQASVGGSATTAAEVPVIVAEVLSGAREPSAVPGAPDAMATVESRPPCSVARHTASPQGVAEPSVLAGFPVFGEHLQLPSSCACRVAPPVSDGSGAQAEGLANQKAVSESEQPAHQCCQPDIRADAAPPAGAYSDGGTVALVCGADDFERAGSTTTIAGLVWTLPHGVTMQQTALLWIGDPDGAALAQLQLTYNQGLWASYDPAADAYSQVRRC